MSTIEQAKQEMYTALANLKGRIEINYSIKDMQRGADEFEGILEEYLERMRQDHDALQATARKRFEDIQSLDEASSDLGLRLAKMTQERDDIQGRLHAVDYAHTNLDLANKIAGEELKNCQRDLSQWKDFARQLHALKTRYYEQSKRDRDDVIQAEKLSDDLDEKLRASQAVVGHQEQLIAGLRLQLAKDIGKSEADGSVSPYMRGFNESGRSPCPFPINTIERLHWMDGARERMGTLQQNSMATAQEQGLRSGVRGSNGQAGFW